MDLQEPNKFMGHLVLLIFLEKYCFLKFTKEKKTSVQFLFFGWVKSFWICGMCIINEMVRVFTGGPGDRGSIQGRDIPKTQKMVLDAYLINTQHYKF